MIAIRTTRKSSAILVLIVCAACSEDHRPADSTAWRFRWNTNGKDYTCVVSDEMVGDVQMQSLRIPTPNGKDFRRPPTGGFLGATFLRMYPPNDETFLVTQWTGGANTFDVTVYRMHGGRVEVVLSLLTATTELGVFDVDRDGNDDLIVAQRKLGEGGMAMPEFFVYFSRNGAFTRSRLAWPIIPADAQRPNSYRPSRR